MIQVLFIKKLSKVYYLVNEDKTEILGAFLSYKDICDFHTIEHRKNLTKKYIKSLNTLF